MSSIVLSDLVLLDEGEGWLRFAEYGGRNPPLFLMQFVLPDDAPMEQILLMCYGQLPDGTWLYEADA